MTATSAPNESLGHLTPDDVYFQGGEAIQREGQDQTPAMAAEGEEMRIDGLGIGGAHV